MLGDGHACEASTDQGAGARSQGSSLMSGERLRKRLAAMFRYVLQHRQEPHECGVVFAASKGHGSALRHQRALRLPPLPPPPRLTATPAPPDEDPRPPPSSRR